jgi:hypothetical protein
MAASPEQKKSYHVTKAFKGLNTKANRTAIGEDEFSWIENAQPIGFGNIRIVPGPETINANVWSNTTTYFSSVNIGLEDYLLSFQDNGAAQYVTISNNTRGNIAAAGTFSNSGVQVTQWDNERALIIDPVKGYKTWDGTNLVSVGSVGTITVTAGGNGYTSAPTVTISGPDQTGGVQATATAILANGVVTSIILTQAGTGYTNSANLTVTISASPTANNATANATIFSQVGSAIASFSGRVWIADQRTIYYSAAGSYNDFTSVSAGSIVLTDSTLHGYIKQLVSANNFLYIFGDDSINVFSDVRVNDLGVTLFTNTNISASIGSQLPEAIIPFFRSILFMNNYGVYALVGTTTTKISDALDGIIPDVDFNSPVYAGQVLINNILCAAFNFRYNDGGNYRYIQAVFFDKKWFIGGQGDDVKYIYSVPRNGLIKLYSTNGTDLKQIYGNVAAEVDTYIETALWPLGDPIRTKQALKVGIEATLANSILLTATIDSENQTSPVIYLSNSIIWTNYLNNPIDWVNNSSQVVLWSPTNQIDSYYLYKADAPMWGKYIGVTLTATGADYTINGFQLEHELRVRF